jgi:hypothetical protein
LPLALSEAVRLCTEETPTEEIFQTVVAGLHVPPNERCAACTWTPFVMPGPSTHSSFPAGSNANALGVPDGKDGEMTTG